MSRVREQGLFRRIVRSLLPRLFLFAGEVMIFIVIFSLYQLEWEALAYAVGLCLLLQLMAMGFTCRQILRDHRAYRQFLGTALWECGKLPLPRTLTEEDAREILLALSKQTRELSDRLENRRAESLDYYTAWVHQIKTPIASLHMFLDQEDTEEHRAMQAELFKIEQYVSLALSFIRLEDGNHDLLLREVPLDPILRAAIRKYAPLMVRGRLRLQYDPTSLTVLTDEKWLQFIVEQLLSNALKYTREGGITITVTKDGRLTVADTGIGIAPEDLPRIFEKGFTGYNGRADKKASGLGLYLARQAADLLSLSLTADSVPGKGSTFTLDLSRPPVEIE